MSRATVRIHQISDTARSRLLIYESQMLVLREALRTVNGGQAWCITGCELVPYVPGWMREAS